MSKGWQPPLLERGKSYRYSEKERQWLETVLKDYGVPYQFSDETVEVPLSGNQFHEVVKDAACLRETMNAGAGIPYITWSTFLNSEKRDYVCTRYGSGKAFMMLPGHDREQFDRCFLS